MGPYRITIFGHAYVFDSQWECFACVLREFAVRDSKFLARLAAHQDRKTRLVARTPAELHTDHHRPEFIQAHSHQVVKGWWIWKNRSRERVLRNIVYACVFAGWTHGKDVAIDYQSWGYKSHSSPLLAD